MPSPWEDAGTRRRMIVTTTTTVEGRMATDYLGIVTGEAIMGANIFRDLFAGIRDIVGGRAGAYENVLREGREQALAELAEDAEQLGADAVIGVSLSYMTVGNESMLMVAASGTAVKLG